MLHNTSKDTNYRKVKEIVDQRLNDKKPLLVTALIAVLSTLKANPYGLNLLNTLPLVHTPFLSSFLLEAIQLSYLSYH